ncbi:PKD domain-containing protein [Blastococcus sp. TBT05-19]|uniref:PKD domain-containing protein n=1 Tax=Blastococcus sp. TBT05-19 TaxID=2250581 RepID=UPI00131403E2|nr:hypothetical protein [Blastococcus sp. TBT05-19]
MTLRFLLRLVVVCALAAGALTVLPTAASAATLEATVVAARDTSVWERPSPDPSGITYDPVRRQLIISDGEVDEMALYAGTNLFLSSLDGTQAPDFPGGTTLPHSNEPAGVSYRSADGTLFVSDDDKDRIFSFEPGGDGRHGTGDDTVTSFSTRDVIGNSDPEDVAVDMDVTANGHVLVIDGTDKEVFDYGPGDNGVFDGLAPDGDDTVTSFDVSRHGALDPEGLVYQPQRGTILVLDDASEKIYEVNRQGALLNVVDIAPVGARKTAGMTLAPASDGSGRQNLYVVARGYDNDFDPNENDGMFYELAVDFPPVPDAPPNAAPTADAGPDATVIAQSDVTLQGSVSDDGLPNPPGATSATWRTMSGPAQAAFADPSAATTAVSFPEPGLYVLRLTADDGQLVDSDEVRIAVRRSDGSGVFDVPLRAGSDDAEGRFRQTFVDGNDLELVTDGTSNQQVGLRFAGVPVPQGATVTSAHVQFSADEVTTGAADLLVQGEAADDTEGFTSDAGSVSSRPRTEASVAWQPAPWSTVGARGIEERTPDLTSIVQQIVSREGWAEGNAMTFVLTGTGTRTADAYEGGPQNAAALHVEFAAPLPANTAPTASAGPDVSVERDQPATLAGTVSDDGLPSGSTLAARWTQLSGPGTATFADASAASTTATFSAAGTYVLRLTADDGELTGTDDLTVDVVEPPVVAPVPVSGSVDVPVRAGADDAEERVNGSVYTSSGDLNLAVDGTRTQTIGMRFAGVEVPRGATITAAHVQFQADEVDSGATTLRIAGQAADDAAAFTATLGNISARPLTGARVEWAPAEWTTLKERGPAQRTPDLSAVVQEVVDRTGWSDGQALALVVTGSGTRTAEAYEGGAARAPVLHIEFSTDGTEPGNGGDGPGDGGADPGTGGTDPGTGGTDPGNGGTDPGTDGGVVTLSVPVTSGLDDAEERAGGAVGTTSGDLNLALDGTRQQTIGIRFAGVAVPAGATILEAHVQFQADEADSGASSLTVAGQAADSATSFSTTAFDVSSRPRTSATVDWSPAPWPTLKERGVNQRTPDLAAVLQEIVDRPGWAEGNALALLVTGSGTRTAESFEGGAAKAPVLVLRYTM